MSNLTECLECGTDLTGDPIPQESIDAGHYGTATHFRKEIGVEVPGAYDGILYWTCPEEECNFAWAREFPGHGNRTKGSQRYVDEHNAAREAVTA